MADSEPLVGAKIINQKGSDSSVVRNKMDFSEEAEDGSSILRKIPTIDLEAGSGGDKSESGGAKDKSTTERENSYLLIERFHEDALEQTGHGKMQFILFIIAGLALSADLSELLALIMSTKSSQFEFCVDETQKSWIVGASLIGMSLGSIFWGLVGDKIGRSRTLLYSLGFSSIFSLSSVIMPTEGTFLTARIFAGIGLGGAMPNAISYFGEFIKENRKKFATTLLFLFWPLGGAYVILVAWLILPSTGFHMSEELKEHFSAWRRLLLASWAPSGLALLLIIFVPEAPLNLMLNGRDAESLESYQKIHKMNKGSEAVFRFSELDVPPIYSSDNHPRSPMGDLIKYIVSLWSSFLLVWKGKRSILSITLILVFFMASLGQGALSSWIISIQSNMRDWTLDKDAKEFKNEIYFSLNLTNNIINKRYRECTFETISFQDIMLNHVKFENSTFKHVNFTNVKTSYVLFKDSILTDCYFVDSDLGRSNFKNCNMENITYSGLDPSCHQIPDFSSDLANDIVDSGLPVVGIFGGSILAVILISFVSRAKLTAILLLLSSLISIFLTIWKTTSIWAMIGHSIINVLLACIWSILLTITDKYPSSISGVTLGLFCSAARLGSFFGVGLFGTTLGSGILVPIFSSIFFVLASCLAFRGQF